MAPNGRSVLRTTEPRPGRPMRSNYRYVWVAHLKEAAVGGNAPRPPPQATEKRLSTHVTWDVYDTNVFSGDTSESVKEERR
jgi:hypothetical protein